MSRRTHHKRYKANSAPQANPESRAQEGGSGFLNWLRNWPLDWVAVVAFVCVFAAFMVASKPAPEGTSEAPPTIQEIVSGDVTVVEAEARLSKEMTPITIDENSPLYEYYVSDDRVNILLLGINDGMTDTIMVATYDMEDQTVDIISIPRDTYYFRGNGYQSYAAHKINAIYHSDGVVKLAEAVSDTLYGMPIHYYAIIDYAGVKKVMSAVGGVKFNVPFHMKYDDTTPGYELHIDIPAGEQLIDSSNVMQLLRFRKTNPAYTRQGYQSYPGGDIQRIQLQQDFVKAVVKQALKPSNIVDVSKVLLESVESDMTYGMAAKVAAKAVNFDFGSVETHLLPGTDKLIKELSFWVADETEVFSMLEEIFIPPQPEETTGEGITTDAAVAQ